MKVTWNEEAGKVEMQVGKSKQALEPDQARELATAIRAALPKGSKAAGAGGSKGEAIVKRLKKDPDASPADIAKAVGCSTARVYEVRRAMEGDK